MAEKDNNINDLNEQTPAAGEQPAQEQDTPCAQQPEKSETELLREEMEQYKDKMLRAYAELENVKKRTQREKDMLYPEAVAATAEKFLPVLDNFERALSQEGGGEEFRKGVEMIYVSLLSTMQALTVTAFGEVGETFDPALHNAVLHTDDGNRGEKEIVEVFQKGYRIGNRIMRFAMVKVAN